MGFFFFLLYCILYSTVMYVEFYCIIFCIVWCDISGKLCIVLYFLLYLLFYSMVFVAITPLGTDRKVLGDKGCQVVLQKQKTSARRSPAPNCTEIIPAQ